MSELTACEVKHGCSGVDLGLSPVEQFVCDIVLVLDGSTVIFLIAQGVSTFDGVWFPCVTFVAGAEVSDFALDWTSRPNVVVAIVAFQVTEPFLFLWSVVSLADSLHSWKFGEVTIEVRARV